MGWGLEMAVVKAHLVIIPKKFLQEAEMSVADILKHKGSNVFTVRPEHAITDAAIVLTDKNVGVLVVTDAKGKVVGLLSERDVVRAMAKHGKGSHEMPVRNFMSSPAVVCAPQDSAKRILQIMTDRRIRHLPVVDHDELLGIVSIGDAVNHRLSLAQEEVGVLRDIATANVRLAG